MAALALTLPAFAEEEPSPELGGECYYDLLVKDREMSMDMPSWWDGRGRLLRGFFEEQYASIFNEEFNPAAEACKEAFLAGDARSGFWLAEYYKRLDREQEALFYLEKAAAMEDAYSLSVLGWRYIRGYYDDEGTEHPRDVEKGFDYLLRAANNGYGKAQGTVAHFYHLVKDFPRHNLSLAYNYYLKAAENGYGPVMYGPLRHLYLRLGSGECHDSDAGEAIQNIREELSVLDIQCDVNKALNYLTQVAEMGDPIGMKALALVYEEQGNMEKAAYWYALMSQWEPSDEFYADLKDYASFQFFAGFLTHSPHISYTDAAELRDEARQKVKELKVAQAISKKAEGYRHHACRYNDFSWYYKCKNIEE